ncbi:MAG: phosphoribosylglycinamide formyltransferase [Pseudomonadota bacterium]
MSKPLRLVVLISGNGSNLQSIIDAVEAGHLNAEIVAVVSNNPHAYGLQRARNHDIPSHSLDHRLFSDRAQFDQEMRAFLQEMNPDYVVLAGFMCILGAELVRSFRHRILNIHPSILPEYKGLNTHLRALQNGETEHGVTIHLVTAELDDGPILLQGRYAIEPEDKVTDLQKKGHALEHQMYPQLLQWIAEEKIVIDEDQVLYEQVALEKPLEFRP